MALKGLFRNKKTTSERTPPAKEDWPTHMKTLDQKGFDDFIEKYPVSLVDFYSPFCGPCKTMTSRLRNLSKDYKYRVAFAKIDVTENQELAKRFKIMSVPHMMVFSYGKKVGTMMGKKDVPTLTKVLDKVLAEVEKG